MCSVKTTASEDSLPTKISFHLVRAVPVERRHLLDRRTLLLTTFAVPFLLNSSACSPQSEEAVLDLLNATIQLFTAAKTSFGRAESVGGHIQLANTGGDDIGGYLSLALLHESGRTIDSGKGEYSIPRYTVNEYEWTGLRSDEVGNFQANAVSALSNELTDLFSIF